MNNIYFILFGTLESFSIVLLGILLFRLRLNKLNISKSILIGFIVQTISLFLIRENLNTINPFVQMIFMYLLIYLLLERKLLRSLIITITPYVLFAFIQATFILITNYYKIITFSEVQPFSLKGYIVQISSFIIVSLIGVVVKYTNEGYAYIPEEPFKKNAKFKYSNQLLFFAVNICVLLVLGSFHIYMHNLITLYFIPLFAILSLSSFVLLFINFKRDKEEWSQL